MLGDSKSQFSPTHAALSTRIAQKQLPISNITQSRALAGALRLGLTLLLAGLLALPTMTARAAGDRTMRSDLMALWDMTKIRQTPLDVEVASSHVEDNVRVEEVYFSSETTEKGPHRIFCGVARPEHPAKSMPVLLEMHGGGGHGSAERAAWMAKNTGAFVCSQDDPHFLVLTDSAVLASGRASAARGIRITLDGLGKAGTLSVQLWRDGPRLNKQVVYSATAQYAAGETTVDIPWEQFKGPEGASREPWPFDTFALEGDRAADAPLRVGRVELTQ